ncbi:MAG TPA: lysophospholipid acyltransferase family protein [Gemmataceae bacterium]|jgi:1-acyl-sn-glycerol-3-phosphate acyltransferase|nr:lysophospholipid acyltransferase family protein [Gemmataceae bacterium]
MSAVVSAVVYEFSFWVVFFLYVIGLRLRVFGRRNIPRRGSLLVIGNHQSLLDPIGIGLGIPRHLHYLARKTLFKNPAFGLWLRTVHAVPIDQEGVGKEGIRNILASLSAGNAVLVFPEGQRCTDGRLQPLRPGIGLLVSRARAPILPAGIAGAYDAWPRNKRWPTLSPLFLPWTRRSLTVVYGRPRDPATLEGLSREEILKVLHDDLAAVVKEAEAQRNRLRLSGRISR